MAKVMMTIKRRPEQASIDSVSKDLGLEKHQIDPDFGVTALDPDQDLYAILVDEHEAERLQGHAAVEGGPFSNPKLETFGPPPGPSSDRKSDPAD